MLAPAEIDKISKDLKDEVEGSHQKRGRKPKQGQEGAEEKKESALKKLTLQNDDKTKAKEKAKTSKGKKKPAKEDDEENALDSEEDLSSGCPDKSDSEDTMCLDGDKVKHRNPPAPRSTQKDVKDTVKKGKAEGKEKTEKHVTGAEGKGATTSSASAATRLRDFLKKGEKKDKEPRNKKEAKAKAKAKAKGRATKKEADKKENETEDESEDSDEKPCRPRKSGKAKSAVKPKARKAEKKTKEEDQVDDLTESSQEEKVVKKVKKASEAKKDNQRKNAREAEPKTKNLQVKKASHAKNADPKEEEEGEPNKRRVEKKTDGNKLEGSAKLRKLLEETPAKPRVRQELKK